MADTAWVCFSPYSLSPQPQIRRPPTPVTPTAPGLVAGASSPSVLEPWEGRGEERGAASIPAGISPLHSIFPAWVI